MGEESWGGGTRIIACTGKKIARSLLSHLEQAVNLTVVPNAAWSPFIHGEQIYCICWPLFTVSRGTGGKKKKKKKAPFTSLFQSLTTCHKWTSQTIPGGETHWQGPGLLLYALAALSTSNERPPCVTLSNASWPFTRQLAKNAKPLAFKLWGGATSGCGTSRSKMLNIKRPRQEGHCTYCVMSTDSIRSLNWGRFDSKCADFRTTLDKE